MMAGEREEGKEGKQRKVMRDAEGNRREGERKMDCKSEERRNSVSSDFI